MRATQQSSLESILDNYVRLYEEKLIIDVAAEIYANHSRQGGLRLHDLHECMNAAPETVTALFHMYDEDNSGTIDAKELLGIMRYVNFMVGYCDACFKPVAREDNAFTCVQCEDYLLCGGCYPNRGYVHSQHGAFQPAAFLQIIAATNDGLPPQVGSLLRQQVSEFFEEIDADGDGEITVHEFLTRGVQNGWSPESLNFVLQFDINGDGRISPREALYMFTGMGMMRGCDECGEMSFITNNDMLSCTECTADYDVCASCWNAGKCSHPHDRFGTTKPFQLRELGLYYERGQIVADDWQQWEKYKPFVGDNIGYVAAPSANNYNIDKSPSLWSKAGSSLYRGVVNGAAESLGEEIVGQAVGLVDESLGEDFVGQVVEYGLDILSMFFC